MSMLPRKTAAFAIAATLCVGTGAAALASVVSFTISSKPDTQPIVVASSSATTVLSINEGPTAGGGPDTAAAPAPSAPAGDASVGSTHNYVSVYHRVAPTTAPAPPRAPASVPPSSEAPTTTPAHAYVYTPPPATMSPTTKPPTSTPPSTTPPTTTPSGGHRGGGGGGGGSDD
jgi:hypothetical protein